jgi:replication-associated recombination protein RarA
MHYQMKTKKGYDFFEVSSAFQKAIRRGDEEVALFFAMELEISHFGEYAWKRMRIITSEDVGLAEPMMPANIMALYDMYCLQKKKKDDHSDSALLFLIHAVLLLSRARKSRLVDWAIIALANEHPSRHLEISEYAYDKHNQKGRSLGRGWDHFFNEGTKLENHTPVMGEEEFKARAYESQTNPMEPIDSADRRPKQTRLLSCFY